MSQRIGLTVGFAVLAVASTIAVVAFPPWGVDLDYVDTSTAPGADFFKYTNGRWLATAVIPSDRRFAGVNLELDRGNEERLKTIVADLLAKSDSALSVDERKLRDLYSAYLDTATIEAAGLAPVKGDLDRIAHLNSPAAVAAFMASPLYGVSGPFEIEFRIDEKNPQAYSVRLAQSGLGMPDRDYYLRDDPELASTREAYKRYLSDMLAFAGIHDAARAAAVYELEHALAVDHWPAEERRDADKNYNPMTVEELEKFAPQFPWRAFLGGADISAKGPAGSRRVVVGQKSAFPKLAATFGATSLAVWRDYLTIQHLHAYASILPKRIDDTDFGFYGTVIGGQKQDLPRDLRAIHILDVYMGEAFGRIYRARYFPPEAKTKAVALVGNLLKAYEADIGSLAWMTPATRAKALEKLHTFAPKIGYPDTWRDYGTLAIERGKIVTDLQNARAFEWRRQRVRIDSAVDRAEWFMTPPTNNAYYNPTLNEIVFPAGILQPPFFDADADDAVNYGEIGATIGHEISHGFDDQGSKYDASGRLHSWWTDEDRKEFDTRTAKLALQYDQFEPLPGLHINGKLTLGENIADLAGLVIAHNAYRLSLGDKPAPVLNGYTGDQRFYIAYGQSWREIWTDGRTRTIVLSNPHSPSAYRVNGVVRNDDGWYAAFPQMKPGEALYLPPEQRIRLW